jgi:tetratricopeptide (TPR) repeat protein
LPAAFGDRSSSDPRLERAGLALDPGRFDPVPAEAVAWQELPEPQPRARGAVAAGTTAPERASSPERQEEHPAASAPSASPKQEDAGHADAEAVANAEAADAAAVINALARHEADASAETGQWQTLYLRGHHAQLEGDLVAAADAYRRASTLNPHHAAIVYDLGYVLQIQKQPQAAMQAYRQTLALDPSHAYAHYNLGSLLQQEGNHVAALEHFRSAAAWLPNNPYVFYDWAASLEAIEEPAEAAKLYRRAIDIDPEHQSAADAQRRLVLLSQAARFE